MVFGTGINAPTLHEEPLRTTFQTRSFGSNLLNLIRIGAIIIIPVVIAWYTSSMWKKTDMFVVQAPTTTYTGRYLLRAVDAANNEYLYTSSDAVRSMLDSDARNAAPFLSFVEDDIDGDGKADQFVFTLAIAPRVAATSPIMKVEFLPTFDYEFRAGNEIDLFHRMNSGVLVSIQRDVTELAMKNSATAVHVVEGDLVFRQTSALDAYFITSYAEHYLPTLLDDNSVKSISDIRNIGNFARRYAMRNESLEFVSKTQSSSSASSIVLSAYDGDLSSSTSSTNVGGVAGVDPATQTMLGSGATSDPDAGLGLMTVQIRMRVVPAVVLYKPSPAEVAKNAWIQWFAIGSPIYWVVSGVIGVLVRGAFVKTTAVFQGRVQPY